MSSTGLDFPARLARATNSTPAISGTSVPESIVVGPEITRVASVLRLRTPAGKSHHQMCAKTIEMTGPRPLETTLSASPAVETGHR